MKNKATITKNKCVHIWTAMVILDDGALVNACLDCGSRCLLSEKELKEWEEYSKEAEEYELSKYKTN